MAAALKQFERETWTYQDDVLRFRTSPDQVWAIDTNALYYNKSILEPLGGSLKSRLVFFDLIVDALLIVAVIGVFAWGFVVAVPLIIGACLLRVATQRLSGELAAKAAQESTDAFLYLYNNNVLWLEQPTTLS